MIGLLDKAVADYWEFTVTELTSSSTRLSGCTYVHKVVSEIFAGCNFHELCKEGRIC